MCNACYQGKAYDIGRMPFTYLGLPLGTTKTSVRDLMPMVGRIERILTANFMMMMSYSGRVSVINSLLTYVATFTVCAIDKIRRHCLWDKKHKMEIIATL